MILEVAVLNVVPGRERDFEQTFARAKTIIAGIPGFRSLELQRCLEVSHRFVLLVHWDTVEDHVVGFRGSPQYAQWKAMLHHFYAPFPTVEHYALVDSALPTSAAAP